MELRARTATLVVVVGLSVALLCFGRQPKPITNADVENMVKAGLAESTILLAIRGGPTALDTSPAALVQLKKAGVSSAILEAMLRASSTPVSSTRPPLRTPTKIPDEVNKTEDEPPPTGMGGLVGGMPGGVPDGQMGEVLGGILAPKVATPQRVGLSQGVTEGNLVNRVTPLYPDIAKREGIQGIVVLQAVIGKQGTIENLRVVSGHPMLVQAALDAVKQWRYRPYLRNGEPVEVETQITVNFSLTGASGQTATPGQEEQEWDTTQHTQQEAQLRPLIERVCRGAWLPLDPDPQRPEAPAIKRLGDALGNIWQWSPKEWAPLFGNTGNRQILVAVASNNEINAWEADIDPQHSLVCIPSGMIRFMGNEDEIAFIVAHEIGHAMDDGCRTAPGVRHTAPEQVQCEIRADEIGYTLLRRAGYSPYAAAGAFGRLEMYSGDTHTGIVGWLRQMTSDHPITPRRIENMREMLLREIQASPTVPR